MAPLAHGSTPKPHASAEASPAGLPEASAVRDTATKLGPGLIAAKRRTTAAAPTIRLMSWMTNLLLHRPRVFCRYSAASITATIRRTPSDDIPAFVGDTA